MKGHFYFPREFERLWETLDEIAKREGRSRSKILRECVEEYVRLHELGNPQTRLDVILDRGAPAKEPPRCSYCSKPATYISYLKDGLFSVARAVYTCDLHRNLHRAQSPYYGERKL